MITRIRAFLAAGHIKIPRRVPYFVKNTILCKNKIIDESISNEIEINSTGYEIFKLVDGKNDIGKIVMLMEEKYPKVKKQINKDVNMLLKMANSRNIINFKFDDANFLSRYIFKLFSNVRHKTFERYDIESSKFHDIFLKILYSISYKFILLWGIVNIFLMVTLLIIPGSMKESYELMKAVILFFNSAYIGLFTSIALHETLHIYLYRKKIKNDKIGYFSSGMLTFFFVRPSSLEDGILTKLLGGLIPSIIGIIGIMIIRYINIIDIKIYLYVCFIYLEEE